MLYLGRVLAEGTPGEIRGRLEAEVLDCRSSDSQAAQSLVAHLPGVIEVQTLGDRLRILVDHASTRLPELATAMATRGIAVGEIRQVQPGLEEVFISFVQGQRQSLPQASLPPDSLRHGGAGE